MNTDTLDQVYAQAEGFVAPMVKANQMAVANVEKLVERQHMLDDIKALTELGSDMREDMTKMAEDNVKEFKTAATKTAKKVA